MSVILCAALLSGCSLFESEEKPANVYLAGDIVHPSSSSSASSTVSDEGQFGVTGRPTSSSSTQTSSSSRPVTVTPAEESEPVTPLEYYRGKWYYNTLSAKRKAVYARLFYCAKNNIEECDVSDLKVTAQDVYVAYWAFDYENPQFLELGSGYELTYIEPKVSNKIKTVKILYGRTPGEVDQAGFEARAEAVLEEARALSSDYERLKYVHDWIVDNTVYIKDGAVSIREADGAIVYGQALCEGYSKAFMYFAQSLGYQCICSVGVANLEDHMWNMVRIGGSWYNVDVTWDDPKTSNGTQTLRHEYFLINDAELRLDHRVEHPIMLPNAPKGFFPYGYDQDGGESNSSAAISSSNAAESNTSAAVN